MMKRTALQLLAHITATVIFLAMAIVEIKHDASASQWPGYGIQVDYVACLLVPLWVAAAASVFLRGYVADFLLISGVLAMVIHGTVTRIGNSPYGYAFLGLGVVTFLLSVPTRHLSRSGKVIELSDELRRRHAA